LVALKMWLNSEPTEIVPRLEGFITGICRVVWTVRAKDFAARTPFESVSQAVNVATPGVVGVPVIVPLEFRDKPTGSKPLKRDHEDGARPPVAFNV
jgi:hypothetical protein